MDHPTDPKLTCHDCHEPLAPGESRVADGDTVCVPCFDVREMAWRRLASDRQAPAGVRRGPRQRLPRELAARTAVSWTGVAPVGDAGPIVEISRHGFRIEVGRELAPGQRLSCEARLPGQPERSVRLEVEVRWCRREQPACWDAGVEVAAADLDRYGELYHELLSAAGGAA